MGIRSLAILLIILIFLPSVYAYPQVSIQYTNPSKGEFIITVSNVTLPNEKVLIIQVYINRTLYQTFYYNGNESYPIVLKISLGPIKGLTYFGVRIYTNTSGWSNLYEITVNSNGIVTTTIDITRDITLLIGLILLIAGIIYFVRRI